MAKKRIYLHGRVHEHHIDFSNVNLDMFKDVPEDIELKSVIVNNILDD